MAQQWSQKSTGHTQQWSRESRPARGDRDHSLPHRSRSPIGHGRSPPQRKSHSPPQRHSGSGSPPRRADDLRPRMSWEAQQQQRRHAPFEGGRAPTATGRRCRFFGSLAGCKKGRDCNFAHVTSGQQPQQPQRREPTEAWRAQPPPQPVRHLPRAPPPQPTGPSTPVASAAHQVRSRLELRVTPRSQPSPAPSP